MPDPIQEQLVIARRNQILDAAINIFAEKGFHKATIKDIAREAGIADGTIYIYFGNKTALMLAILDRINETDDRGFQFEQAQAMDFADFLQAYMKYRFSILRGGDQKALQVVFSEVLVNKDLRDLYFSTIIQPTTRIAVEYAKGLVEAGMIKPVDPYLLTVTISSLFLGMQMMMHLGDEELSQRQDELPEFIANLILEGIKKEN